MVSRLGSRGIASVVVRRRFPTDVVDGSLVIIRGRALVIDDIFVVRHGVVVVVVVVIVVVVVVVVVVIVVACLASSPGTILLKD